MDKNMSDAVSRIKWDSYFMELAELVASKAKDASVKVGCVLTGQNSTILSTGYNGFPRGVDEDEEPERNERPEKYFWTEHAERNAIYNAALNGMKTQYATAYCTAAPCVDCARAFVQAGIQEVYIPAKTKDPFFTSDRWDRWEASITKAQEILEAAGVIVHHVV